MAVVAKVNGKEITEQELHEMAEAYKRQTQTPELSEETKKMILESIIDNRLLQEEAVARNIVVTDEILEQQMSHYYQQFGSEDNFAAMLAQQNIDLQEIKDNVRTDLTGQLTAQNEIEAKLEITDEDLTEFYEQNKSEIVTSEQFRASHILFKVEEENAKEKAEQILKELKDGADFAVLAQKHSTCPSGQNGGDLNFFGRGQMVPKFEQAVVAMNVGDISDLVETQFGYHIIKKTDEQPGKQLTFDEAKSQIKEVVSQQKSQVILKNFLTSLREKYTVEYVN